LLGSTLGDAVGSELGATDGDTVGGKVGCLLGGAVGPIVGGPVGVAVGNLLGDCDGAADGVAVENIDDSDGKVTLPNPVTGSQPALVTNPDEQQVAVVEEELAQHLLSPDVISLKRELELL